MLRNGEVISVMDVNGGEQVIELHARSSKDLRLIFHTILGEGFVHVQSFELICVVLQDGLPLVARRMLVVFGVPVEDLVDRLLRGHLQTHITPTVNFSNGISYMELKRPNMANF